MHEHFVRTLPILSLYKWLKLPPRTSCSVPGDTEVPLRLLGPLGQLAIACGGKGTPTALSEGAAMMNLYSRKPSQPSGRRVRTSRGPRALRQARTLTQKKGAIGCSP